MAMRMWLDDVRTAPEGWVWVKTYQQAITCLEGNNVVQVSLDHDLGEEKTGYNVAQWIEERAASGNMGKILWSVHSANTVGRKRIEAAMRSAESFWE